MITDTQFQKAYSVIWAYINTTPIPAGQEFHNLECGSKAMKKQKNLTAEQIESLEIMDTFENSFPKRRSSSRK